ncbi:MAG: DUF6265 family protein [Pseudomonadota bacterium]
MMLGAALATALLTSATPDLSQLSWLAGIWIAERDGVTVRETWLAPLDGAMAGAGQTNRPGRRPFVEHMKITAEPAGVTFTAFVPGQPPTPFVLLPGPDGEATFENKAHDFPQRVIYRRCGEDLCAAVEGEVSGELKREEWRYRRAD